MRNGKTLSLSKSESNTVSFFYLNFLSAPQSSSLPLPHGLYMSSALCPGAAPSCPSAFRPNVTSPEGPSPIAQPQLVLVSLLHIPLFQYSVWHVSLQMGLWFLHLFAYLFIAWLLQLECQLHEGRDFVLFSAVFPGPKAVPGSSKRMKENGGGGRIGDDR